MPVRIPLNDASARYRMEIPLDGVTYLLRVDYRPRTGRWFLSIYARGATTPILASIALTVGEPLLYGRGRSGGLPPGDLIVVDKLGAEDPARVGLGDRWALLYYTAAEMEAAAA